VTTFNLDTATKTAQLLKLHGFNDSLTKWATAQAAHETNGFTSNILKSNNNLFGMKYAKQIYAQGEKNGYANYLSIENSVIDFISWYNRHRSSLLSMPLVILNLNDYVSFLKNQKYFEANETEYLKGCQYFYNILFS
jgi:hypothetical protein